jgi:hypothetical protein
LAASIMPAAVQRSAMAAFRHRFTLRQTRRTARLHQLDREHDGGVETFEDAGGNAAPPCRSCGQCCEMLTVNRLKLPAPAAVRSSRSALSASSSSRAWRSARRTDACRGLGSRSITLRAAEAHPGRGHAINLRGRDLRLGTCRSIFDRNARALQPLPITCPTLGKKQT